MQSISGATPPTLGTRNHRKRSALFKGKRFFTERCRNPDLMAKRTTSTWGSSAAFHRGRNLDWHRRDHSTVERSNLLNMQNNHHLNQLGIYGFYSCVVGKLDTGR
jgi:hypothetical protein